MARAKEGLEDMQHPSAWVFPEAERLDMQVGQRQAMAAAYRQDETEAVADCLAAADMPAKVCAQIAADAHALTAEIRAARLRNQGLDAFLAQYDLSSQEGIALMCLAEAMLRVPDKENQVRLIQDKISGGAWSAYQGQSHAFFVNAATWGLMLTGKMLPQGERDADRLGSTLQSLVARMGAPVVRNSVAQAMKVLGRQYVMGETIAEALKRATKSKKKGYRYSYDMLGEAALTAADAERYFEAYRQAILEIGAAANHADVHENPGISIKLSALHPRYEWAQQAVAVPQLVHRLTTLALLAKAQGVGLTVDAEEADRLEISLDIIGAVFALPELAGWEGFGLAVQSYQKRARVVLQQVIAWACQHKRRITVRLIKGAYWDTEIKQAQVEGQAGYPVFTRKVATDTSFIACARLLAAAEDAVYPQFATHNARTIAVVNALMGARRDFEFQCLHGMGQSVYDTVFAHYPNSRCRVYAPVGRHEDLLPYLVRRLLENGANTSFVNRIVDKAAPIEDLIADPVAELQATANKPHPNIPLPVNLFGHSRPNSLGIDWSNRGAVSALAAACHVAAQTGPWQAAPLLAAKVPTGAVSASVRPVHNPARRAQQVGQVIDCQSNQIEPALAAAQAVVAKWSAQSVADRAACLERAAQALAAQQAYFMTLLVQEAGKTLLDADAEIREAIDFCYYYAAEARRVLQTTVLPGPTGEANVLSLHPRGVALCISPWNFPLAIFMGQVVAALVTGNAVLAKPAQQTSLVAYAAVKLLHEAGVPLDVLQYLPGSSRVICRPLLSDHRLAAVLLTGSTETAWQIQSQLAERRGPIIPLVAETGGQNVMIADSTTLLEQLVQDVMMSAFGSAGQRCSACRIIMIQAEVADRFIRMLQGAMAEWVVGDPRWLATDVGPVIDADAQAVLQAHQAYLEASDKAIHLASMAGAADLEAGTFFMPCAYELKDLSVLTEEVFGPILHVVRYARKDLPAVIEQINGLGYGLTLGIHTRLEGLADWITERVQVGNVYVNRSMTGAVVGVQPFGGEGLSGTGPKAGGPHYLLRLCRERTRSTNTAAVGGNAGLLAMDAAVS